MNANLRNSCPLGSRSTQPVVPFGNSSRGSTLHLLISGGVGVLQTIPFCSGLKLSKSATDGPGFACDHASAANANNTLPVMTLLVNHDIRILESPFSSEPRTQV